MRSILILVLVTTVAGCAKQVEEAPLPSSNINADKKYLEFDTFFRTDTITIDATGEWTAEVVSPSSRWLQTARIDSAREKLVVYVTEDNTGGNDRPAIIRISLQNPADTSSLSIYVTQLAIPKDTFVFGGEADDVFTSVVRDPGIVIAAGYSESTQHDSEGNHGGKDFWVVRLNDQGSKVWSRCFGGSADDVATTIINTYSNGYLVAGYTFSNDGNVTGNHGGKDAWIILIDTLGELVWQKCIGGSGNDEIVKMMGVTDANVLVSGIKDDDQWLMKITHDGNVLWEKNFGSSSVDFAGGITETQDGYFFTGSGMSNDGDVSDKPTTTYDAWIVKISSAGDVEWKKYIAGAAEDKGICIMGFYNRNVMVCGTTESPDIFQDFSGVRNLFAALFDREGNLLWKKIIKHTEWDEPADMIRTKTDNILIAGKSKPDGQDTFDGSFFVINTNGDLLMSRTVGGPMDEGINSIVRGGYHQNVFVGNSLSFDDINGNPGQGGWFGWLEYR